MANALRAADSKKQSTGTYNKRSPDTSNRTPMKPRNYSKTPHARAKQADFEEISKTKNVVRRLNDLSSSVTVQVGDHITVSGDIKMIEIPSNNIENNEDDFEFDAATQRRFDLSHKVRLLSNIIQNGKEFAIENSFEEDSEFIAEQVRKTKDQQKDDLRNMKIELNSIPGPF